MPIDGTPDDDDLDGTPDGDVIHAGAGDDNVSAGDGADQVYGEAGDDWLDGGSGADMLYGGTDDDVFVVDDAGDVAIELEGDGTDRLIASVSYAIGAGSEIETLATANAAATTAIDLTGNQYTHWIEGNDGVNTLTGGDGGNFLYGFGGADHLIGGAQIDQIFGGSGNDTLSGGGQLDLIQGGDGDDVIDGGDEGPDESGDNIAGDAGNDVVHGNAGDDTLRGYADNDQLHGDAGKDRLEGGEGADTLDGGDDDDLLTGGAGFDMVDGGGGDDIVVIDLPGDIVTGEQASGGAGDDLLFVTNTTFLDCDLSGLSLDGFERLDEYDATGKVGLTIAQLNGFAEIDASVRLTEGGAVSLAGQALGGTLYLSDLGNSLNLNGAIDGGSGTGTHNFFVYGGAAADTMTGAALRDVLDGGGGDDTLSGAGGTDYLAGGAGDDWAYGGAGTDFLAGGENDDTLLGGGGADLMIGGFGNDRLEGGDGNDDLDGSEGNDRIYGGAGDDVIQAYGTSPVDFDRYDGGSGYDSIHVLTSATHLDRAALIDIEAVIDLHGTGFALSPEQLAALDQVSTAGRLDMSVHGAAALAGMTLVAGSIRLAAEGDSDLDLTGVTGQGGYRVEGGEDRDRITGSAGADTLQGAGGDDLLEGGSGDDAVDGGAGTDTASYAGAGGAVSVSLARTTAQNTGGAGIDLLADVENLTGSGFADTLTGDGNANVLDGGAGADTLAGGNGNDVYYVDNAGDRVIEKTGQGKDTVNSGVSFSLAGQYAEILNLTGTAAINGTGNSQNNMITGNGAANILVGGDGDDRLDGGAGADTLRGGLGGDTFVIDQAGDKAFENAGEGNDTVEAWISYSLAGQNIEYLKLMGTANLNATGNSLANTLTGNSGNNVLNGGAGADQMYGGAGDDRFVVDNAGDKVFEANGEGTDLVESSVTFSLAGQFLEELTLTGTAAINGTGNSFANILTGNNAANALNGGGADDELHGGLGSDTLTGGAGLDSFWFETALGATNVDSITDFSVADDTLYLDRTVFAGIAANGALAAGAFRIGTVAADADDRIVYDKPNGNIWYDADGAGGAAAVLFAHVTANTSLTAADFFAVP